MQKAAAQLESLRRRLAASELLDEFTLRHGEAGAVTVDATLSRPGHELVAASGPDDLHVALAATANDSEPPRIAWRFSSGAADPWPTGIKRAPGMLPRIWSWLPAGDEHRFLIGVDDGLSWIEGHFPQIPILAGVVQLHWAALLARGVFGLQEFPRDVMRLKFQRPVLPPAVLELQVQRIDALNIQFVFTSPGQAHSQGRLLFGGEDA